MNAAPFPQLQMFLAVARLGSFSAAARELRVTKSAVSQAVRQLERQLNVVLFARTTRSVSLTDTGRRLLDATGPAVRQTLAALSEVSAQPGEPVGRLRLTVPRAAVPCVIEPVLPDFRARHPRVEIEIDVDQRAVDIVADGYDAGIRLSDAIERDMVRVRLTSTMRFVVVGAPDYLARHGTPQRPEDLMRHECINFRKDKARATQAWTLERGRRTWSIPVRGPVVNGDGALRASLAEQGLGLSYVLEPVVQEQLRQGRLQRVLEPYAATVPGFFLYYPSQAQRSVPLRLFIETAREVTAAKRRRAKA
jgi:DNA-binding transcriptional LysR family regulator